MNTSEVNTSFMDQLFKSLSDSTRRDILKRLTTRELNITEIAEPYELGYAAISKHLKVLEQTNLISRRREGKTYMIQTNTEPLKVVDTWISFFRKFWNEAFDQMDHYLREIQQETELEDIRDHRGNENDRYNNTN